MSDRAAYVLGAAVALLPVTIALAKVLYDLLQVRLVAKMPPQQIAIPLCAAEGIREAIHAAETRGEEKMQQGFTRLIEYEHQQTLLFAELGAIAKQQKELIEAVHKRIDGQYDRTVEIHGMMESVQTMLMQKRAS